MFENDAKCCLENPPCTCRQMIILFTVLPTNISQEERGTKKAFRCSGTEQNSQGRHLPFSHLRKSHKKSKGRELNFHLRPGKVMQYMPQRERFSNMCRDRKGPENKPFSLCKLTFTCGTEEYINFGPVLQFLLQLDLIFLQASGTVNLQGGVCIYIREYVLVCVHEQMGIFVKY